MVFQLAITINEVLANIALHIECLHALVHLIPDYVISFQTLAAVCFGILSFMFFV